MQVDRRNFESVYPEFIKKLRECSFAAIDAEYSGLGPPPGHETETHSLFDSAERRYSKAKTSSCYIICQFGIALFRRTSNINNCYECDCYNFYMFPASYEEFARDEPVLWELSSVMFLKEFGFDFERVFKHGIPFMNRRKAEEFKVYLEKRNVVDPGKLDSDVFGSSVSSPEHRSDQELFDYHRGFARVIQALKNSRKPIVGHNLYTDLILTYHHFVDDLPESYEEYKSKVHETFPFIYDTKAIAHGMRTLMGKRGCREDLSYLNNTSLCSLYKNTSDPPGRNKPVVSLNSDSRVYLEALTAGKEQDLEQLTSSKCHEAGFDACITGAVFTQLVYIMWQHELSSKCLPQNRPVENILDQVRTWVNHVNLSRARLPQINFGGKDPPSHRPPWICVSMTPKQSESMKSVHLKSIMRQCSKVGSCEGIYTSKDKKTALIACSTERISFQIQKHLRQSGYKVSEIPVDDNGAVDVPWGTFFAYAAAFWTLAGLALWLKT